MNALRFIAGFLFNIIMMMFYVPQMGIDVGKICVRDQVWPWEMSDIEIAEKMEDM